MACLSVSENDGPATVVANPIFMLDGGVKYPSAGETYRFEILKADSSRLETLIGEYRFFHFGDESTWGRLLSLKPTTSVHPGLALLRNSQTLLGVIETVAETNTLLWAQPS